MGSPAHDAASRSRVVGRAIVFCTSCLIQRPCISAAVDQVVVGEVEVDNVKWTDRDPFCGLEAHGQ